MDAFLAHLEERGDPGWALDWLEEGDKEEDSTPLVPLGDTRREVNLPWFCSCKMLGEGEGTGLEQRWLGKVRAEVAC